MKKMGKLNDRVVIITGGSSGIGKATAVLFAQEGAKVIIASINPEEGKSALKQISGDSIFIKCDVSRSNDVKRLIDTTISKYGRLDILINNAGIYFQKLIDRLDENEWDKVMDINLKGPFLCSKYALPFLKKSSGTIINTASTLGLVPEAETPAYCASKAGLIMLTKTMALAYSEYNLRINAVCPGPILTPLLIKAIPKEELEDYTKRQTLFKRLGTPEEVAKVMLFLASDDASYVTGAVYTVDGGESIH